MIERYETECEDAGDGRKGDAFMSMHHDVDSEKTTRLAV